MVLQSSSFVGKGECVSESPRTPKKIDPHAFVGQIVIYGLAADGAIRFLHWLVLSLAHEFGQ